MRDQVFALNDANIKKIKECEKRIRLGLDKCTMAMFDSHAGKSKATKKSRKI